MPKKGLIRKNHSFLRHVYRIGREENQSIKIEDEAMIKIFECIEKLMKQQIRYACHLSRLEGKRRVSEEHLERVGRNYLLLVTRPEERARVVKIGQTSGDNLLKKQERILEIREKLRVLRMNEVRNETLANLEKYRKEMRKRVKWFKRMR